MVFFYGCPDDYLLDISVDRFWVKYKNMQIIKMQDKMDLIHSFNAAQSSEGQDIMNRLNWKLEQLKGEERVDRLDDWKQKFNKKKKKKPKELKE